MQLRSRFPPRFVFDSIATSAAPRPFRLYSQPSKRCYADDSKPPRATEVPSASSVTTEDVTEELPSSAEGRRSAVTKRFSHLMDHLQGNIFIASQRINDLTGYSGIEALKSRISALELRVQAAQEAVRSSRFTYKTTVADRASTQREVTTLLARKDSWTPTDLERFTSLYRMDHSNEQAVQEAATRLADAEREAEHAASKLSSSILSRYHEEQIWSDKIRRMSTWGTWGLMGVNVLLFLVFQFGFEPWRRRRLVHGFEEKVKEALEKERLAQASKHDGSVGQIPLDGIVAAGLQELEAEIDGTSQNSDPAVDAVVACIRGDVEQQDEEDSSNAAEVHMPTATLQLKEPETWTSTVKDLFSERLVYVRKQDVTLIALEGAATGAAIVTIIATLILRHS